MEREGLAMFAGALVLGLEGVVAKDSKSPYLEGPAVTQHWLKIKNRDFKRKEPVEFRQISRDPTRSQTAGRDGSRQVLGSAYCLGCGGMVSAWGMTAFTLVGRFTCTFPAAHKMPPSRTH